MIRTSFLFQMLNAFQKCLLQNSFTIRITGPYLIRTVRLSLSKIKDFELLLFKFRIIICILFFYRLFRMVLFALVWFYVISTIVGYTLPNPLYHHHHHVVPPARISLTISRHFSLSFIASSRSSGLHPVSSHSCCM